MSFIANAHLIAACEYRSILHETVEEIRTVLIDGFLSSALSQKMEHFNRRASNLKHEKTELRIGILTLRIDNHRKRTVHLVNVS